MTSDHRLLMGMRGLPDFIQAEKEFELKKQLMSQKAQGSDGGATGFLVDRLMTENPNLSFGDALAQVQTGYRQGVNFQGGAASPIPGLADAKGSNAGTIRQYEADAQNISDMNYDPVTAGLEAQQRLTQDLALKPQIEAANIKATDIANAQKGLGAAEDQNQYVTDLIGQIESSPGLSGAVGVRNPLKGAVPFTDMAIRGSPVADFKAKLEQLGGTQFLEAFQNLKGGGAITEIEGIKAERAIARMQTSQSEKEFRSALSEFKGITEKGIERQRQKAGVQIPPMNAGDFNTPVAPIDIPTPSNPMTRPKLEQAAEVEFKLRKKGFTPEQINEYMRTRGLK